MVHKAHGRGLYFSDMMSNKTKTGTIIITTLFLNYGLRNRIKTDNPSTICFKGKQIEMKFVSTLLAATILAFAHAENSNRHQRQSLAEKYNMGRALQSLGQKWSITNPSVNYNLLHFDLDYKVSDFIQDEMVSYTVYDKDCQEGNNLVIVLNSQKQALTGSTGERILALAVDIDPVTIPDDKNIYRENGRAAEITFCVRFSLQTKSDEPSEVNYLETIISLSVDLSNDFEVRRVTIEPNDSDCEGLSSSENTVLPRRSLRRK
jgi:hypothetical protein